MDEYTSIWEVYKPFACLHLQARGGCNFCRTPFPKWETVPYASEVASKSRDIGPLTLMIAREISAERAARRLKQEQVSAATGIPINTLSKIERGQTAIDIEQIEKIAAAFGILPEDLWAAARRRAARQEPPSDIYLPNGQLDPTKVRGFPPTEEEVTELRR